jgi:hypothetical protein
MRDACCPFAAHRPPLWSAARYRPRERGVGRGSARLGPVRLLGGTTLPIMLVGPGRPGPGGEPTTRITQPAIVKAAVVAGVAASITWGIACGGSDSRVSTATPSRTATPVPTPAIVRTAPEIVSAVAVVHKNEDCQATLARGVWTSRAGITNSAEQYSPHQLPSGDWTLECQVKGSGTDVAGSPFTITGFSCYLIKATTLEVTATFGVMGQPGALGVPCDKR